VRKKELQAALDTPGGVIARTPKLWYDKTNSDTVKAIERLRKALKPFAKRRSSVIPFPVIGAGVGLYLKSGNPFALLLCLIGAAAYVAGTIFVPWYRRRLVRALRRGDYGRAVMFDTDPAWTELNAALQAYGRSLMGIIKNTAHHEAVMSKICFYLHDTYVPRGRLRVLRSVPSHDHPMLVEIRESAAKAARGIHSTITGVERARSLRASAA
jgi:hypothetical protein